MSSRPAPKIIPSPNIWRWPDVYELENRAQDSAGALWEALRGRCDWADCGERAEEEETCPAHGCLMFSAGLWEEENSLGGLRSLANASPLSSDGLTRIIMITGATS